MPDLRKNQTVELEIEDLAYGGAGVARLNGFVVFVRRGVPGDRVTARITKKKRNHAWADIESIDTPSERRIEPPCPLFARCGGCTWQNLNYEDQLEAKRRQVLETLEHLGGLEVPEVGPMVASPEVWNYRNKMEYSFGTDAEGLPILGFHVAGRYDQIFAVDRCLIHPEPFDALLAELTAWAREHGLTSYDPRRHEGFLRHAVMRGSRTTGGVILALITNEGELPAPDKLAERLKAACPPLQGFLWGVNTGVADVAQVQDERHRWGDLLLLENLSGIEFKVSPSSFFQTNTGAAERLCELTLEMSGIDAGSVVLDAYCGSGAIGLHCARVARRVVGVDINRDSIWDARSSAAASGIAGTTFLAAPMNEGLALARQAAGRPFTHVIIDPPRGGMDKKSLAQLIDLKAAKFVYVSCNPATLARDLQTIAEGGYEIDAVRPVDMFPHTYHIETVVRLRRKDA